MADVIGRVPPHNTNAEIALIGAVLFRSKALDEVQASVEKDDFYTKAHQHIWGAILELHNNRPDLTIDMVTLCDYLNEKGVIEECGGIAYIASLTNTVPASTNATYYAQIVRNLSLKRKLLELSIVIGDKALDATEDVKSSIDQLDEKLSALSNNIDTEKYLPSGKFIYKVLDQIHAKMAGEIEVGVSTGFRTLDAYLGGGFKPAEMIIIGARPSVGKTAFALSIAHNMAFHGSNPIKVGFFSLEMSGITLMERLLARESSINSMALRNGLLDANTEQELVNCIDRMYDYSNNLLIQDAPNIKLMEIKAQSRRMVRDEGVKVIFIDYIGLIEAEDSSSSKKRHEQISDISRAIKQLARELNVPIICLSQVNRDAGKDRAPMLADLRESGAIEQDADVVMLLDDASKRLDENNKVAQYAEEETPDANDRNPDSHNREIKVIIAKQRNGSTGAFNMLFRSNFVSFTEIERNR